MDLIGRLVACISPRRPGILFKTQCTEQHWGSLPVLRPYPVTISTALHPLICDPRVAQQAQLRSQWQWTQFHPALMRSVRRTVLRKTCSPLLSVLGWAISWPRLYDSFGVMWLLLGSTCVWRGHAVA
jgi:hypothetical protein